MDDMLQLQSSERCSCRTNLCTGHFGRYPLDGCSVIAVLLNGVMQMFSSSGFESPFLTPTTDGVGNTQRELCDGQSLASPGRWPPGSRLYPSSPLWKDVSERYRRFADYYGTEQLLVSLAMGQVKTCPFLQEDVEALKEEIIRSALDYGFSLERKPGDRTDVPIDSRFLQLLHLSGDPGTGLGEYSQGVKVGPGTKMPRLQALYKPKRKWRLASQYDPHDYLEHATEQGIVWRQNYTSLETLETQVLDFTPLVGRFLSSRKWRQRKGFQIW